jgi:hypothetical protein
LVGIADILTAAHAERASYVQAMELASTHPADEVLPDSALTLLQAFSQASNIVKWNLQVVARRLACLDRSLCILSKQDADRFEIPLRKKRGKSLLQANGRVSWEDTYRTLMENRIPISTADFDAAQEVISFEQTPTSIDQWNKQVWFTPQFLAGILETIQPNKTKCEVEFKNEKILSLTINVYDESDNKLFESQVTINVEDAVADDKKYFLLDKTKRGNGLVKPILQKLHEVYSYLGIRTLRTSAELENGAYVWARAGYLPTASSWNKLSKRVLTKLQKLQESLPDDEKIESRLYQFLITTLANPNPKGIWLIADAGMLVDNKKLGYFLLAGEQWKGYLNLDSEEQMARCRRFMGIENQAMRAPQQVSATSVSRAKKLAW